VDIFGTYRGALPEGLWQPVQHIGYDALAALLPRLEAYTVRAGGGAANAAKMAARLGLRAAFVGAVGRGAVGASGDEFASIIEGELRAAGVEPFLSLHDEPTGACAILRNADDPDAPPVIAASPSAALRLGAQHIPPGLPAVLVEGFLLDRPGLVDFILKSRGPVAIDAGAPHIAAANAERLAGYFAAFPLVLLMNEAEAGAVYCSSRKPGEENHGVTRSYTEDREASNSGSKMSTVYSIHSISGIDAFFLELSAACPDSIAVIKRAERGASAFYRGRRSDCPATPLSVRDSTGAGDAFAAGFLGGLLRGLSVEGCLAAGNAAAALALGTH
jgi:sugar/nucleoside kinase (ribokinase family)